MTKPRKVAVLYTVFDIDGTLFRSSLLLEPMEALISQKMFLWKQGAITQTLKSVGKEEWVRPAADFLTANLLKM